MPHETITIASDGSGDFATFADAITAATDHGAVDPATGPWSRIIVRNCGVPYVENVSCGIKRNLRFEAEDPADKPTLDVSSIGGDGALMYIGCTWDGIHIIGAGTHAGIRGNATIRPFRVRNCEIRAFNRCVYYIGGLSGWRGGGQNLLLRDYAHVGFSAASGSANDYCDAINIDAVGPGIALQIRGAYSRALHCSALHEGAHASPGFVGIDAGGADHPLIANCVAQGYAIGFEGDTRRNNVAHACTTSFCGGAQTGEVKADPLFDYAITGLLTWDAGASPLRDMCPDEGVGVDRLGVTRPQGAGYDAGPYEAAFSAGLESVRAVSRNTVEVRFAEGAGRLPPDPDAVARAANWSLSSAHDPELYAADVEVLSSYTVRLIAWRRFRAGVYTVDASAIPSTDPVIMVDDPGSLDFDGLLSARPETVLPDEQRADYAMRADPDVVAMAGRFVVEAGDYRLDYQAEAFRKRLLRRLVSRPGEWSWMPEYGAGVEIKGRREPLEDVRARVERELRREPDIASVDVIVSRRAGMLVIDVVATSKQGRAAKVRHTARG